MAESDATDRQFPADVAIITLPWRKDCLVAFTTIPSCPFPGDESVAGGRGRYVDSIVVCHTTPVHGSVRTDVRAIRGAGTFQSEVLELTESGFVILPGEQQFHDYILRLQTV